MIKMFGKVLVRKSLTDFEKEARISKHLIMELGKMNGFLRKRSTTCAALMLTAFFFTQPLVLVGAGAKGNLVGFVYDQDGTTPVEGAVIKLKNLATGVLFESPKSDNQGAFKVTDVDQGLYMFGVSSTQGDFNANDVLGINENETAKLAVALKAFEAAEVDPKAEDAPKIAGEKWVGKIISYDASLMEARVFINKNQLKQNENFHVKGDKKKYNSDTDFWQKAKIIKQNGFNVNKAVAGQFYNIPLEKPPLDNDFVYVKESQGLAAFFLTPLGLAVILAGTTAVVVVTVTQKPTASQFRY